MTNRNVNGCIYCGSLGPYTDEHVISAGLGGDDSKWLLKNCVCRLCNTDIFSKLELKFLRSSPIAIARIFLQPTTRKRGSETGVPSLQSKSSFIRDDENGVLYEGELIAGGIGKILPQIGVIAHDKFYKCGPDPEALISFERELRANLREEVQLIEKKIDGSEVQFLITTLSWSEQAYAISKLESQQSRPKNGFWVEPLTQPQTDKDGILLQRVFRRSAGQLVCRTSNSNDAAAWLSLLRNSEEWFTNGTIETKNKTVAGGGVHQQINFDFSAYDRVLTKIGLNLVAFLLGQNFFRRIELDQAIAYARDCVGNIKKYPQAFSQKQANIFGRALPNRHLFALFQGEGPDGTATLVCFARLYGGQLEGLMLGEFSTSIAELANPIVVHANYVDHSIQRMSLEEHVIELAQIYPEDPLGVGTLSAK